MTVVGVAALKLIQVVEVKSLLLVFVAVVVHTAEAADTTLVVRSVGLAFAVGHYTGDLWVCLLVAMAFADEWGLVQCSGDVERVVLWAEILTVLVFGAMESPAREQEQSVVVAGADVVVGSVDMVAAAVGNSVVIGDAVYWDHPWSKVYSDSV